jgi:P4 family phage/plasmid primase-like protien
MMIPAATFDLRTGTGRPPSPKDMITKKGGCACAPPGTPHPLWTAFLERIAPDAELRAFLKRWCGYSMTGATTEHKFCFAYGTGANGKSTFINTITGILGDYATIADTGTFIASRIDRHPTDVAKLHGFRLVVAQETEKGRRWDEAKIKSMTGGDKMTARFMRCDFFDFTPKFKLWITGNYKPILSNVDEAMRRRMLLVPFTVQIPPEDRDPDLFEKLKAEWPAILRWMIDGCLEWQQIGLAPPAIISEATDAYFEDQDLIKQWLDECTERSSNDPSDMPFVPPCATFVYYRRIARARERSIKAKPAQAGTSRHKPVLSPALGIVGGGSPRRPGIAFAVVLTPLPPLDTPRGLHRGLRGIACITATQLLNADKWPPFLQFQIPSNPELFGICRITNAPKA